LVAGVPAGAFIGDVLDWRATLWAIVLLCLPALVAVVLVMLSRSGSTDPRGLASNVRIELAALRERPVQLNMLFAILVNAATFCAFTYLAAIATGPARITEGAVPVLLAVFGGGAFFGVTVAGRFGDRFWHRLINWCITHIVDGFVRFS